jgi:AhpC/TSA family
MREELKVGDKAPAFKLVASDGNSYRLADFKGRSIILFFYPKAMTPGCTQEACDFRDLATSIWGVEGEVALRPQIHGNRAHHLCDRKGWANRKGICKGEGKGSCRRGGAIAVKQFRLRNWR